MAQWALWEHGQRCSFLQYGKWQDASSLNTALPPAVPHEGEPWLTLLESWNSIRSTAQVLWVTFQGELPLNFRYLLYWCADSEATCTLSSNNITKKPHLALYSYRRKSHILDCSCGDPTGREPLHFCCAGERKG